MDMVWLNVKHQHLFNCVYHGDSIKTLNKWDLNKKTEAIYQNKLEPTYIKHVNFSILSNKNIYGPEHFKLKGRHMNNIDVSAIGKRRQKTPQQ